MKKRFTGVISWMLVICMMVSFFAMPAAAAETTIDKTAQWADEGKTIADVTLSVPGDVKVEGADIVFVVDKSQCKKIAAVQLQEMFTALAAAQAQSGADIKVGVVQFNYTDHLDIPLTKLTPENADTLLDQLHEYSGGTNIEAGLLTAKKMLDDDTSVRAENKHVILISDGLTWAFDNAAGNPCTILYRMSKNGPANAAMQGHRSTRPTCDSLNFADIAGYDTWDAYWDQIQEWVANDAGKYDYDISNYEEDSFSDEMKSDAAKAVAPLTSDKDHATCFERAIYDAWLAYTALQQAGYNCYINNVNGNNDSVGYYFMNMLAGDQKAVDFESIKNTIIYAVAEGSYVEDVIGYGDDYNFDFLVDGKITLTVGGVEYTTAKLETAVTGYDVSYSFTKPNATEPTFWLDYVKGNGTDGEKFIWTFGENLSAFYPAKLDYQVELVQMQNDPTEATAKVETNKSAILYPVDTDDNDGTPVVFPVPELEIPKYKVTYEYVGTVPAEARDLPAVAYYFAGNTVTIESDEAYKLSNYTFSGWNDPCNSLAGGKMPAHDVTLTGYYLPINVNVDPPIGIKTDKEQGSDNKYDVTIAVPGDGEAVKVHDEVILVIDGSYSLDTEWPKMKETINAIASKVLGGAGRTQMTIIAFGMGDNIFAEGIKTVDELNAKLENMPLPGNLLYGRSSTNCEAGFNAALKYIQEKQDKLSNVDVIFISDGKINTDEHEDVFDNPSANWMSELTDMQVAEYARWALMTWSYGGNSYYNSCDYIINGKAKPSPAFTKVFEGKTAAEVKAEYYDDTAAEFQANYQIYLEWANEVYTNVYKEAGLTRGKAYPISVVERAFVSYDKANGTRVQDLFYAYLNAVRDYDDLFTRTPAAAEKLAACQLVNELYLVRYTNHWKGEWMTKVNGAKYYSAANVAALVDVIQPLTAELSKTNYTDVVITDYMSKWVILDTTSIYIKNDTTGEIIWTIKDGWKSDTDRPTSKTPVIVDIVESNKYIADDGVTEEINKNGVLYKLTWNVKDDCLLRTDNYSLHYVVTVDTAEEGFVPGVEYPANGHTYVEYEEDGHNDIDVPNVTIPAYTVTYLNGDVTLQKTYPLVTGDEIPDCEDPDEYTDGDDLYIFSGWKLVSGTEGADGTVGTTNLVYQAVYTLSDDVIIDDGDTPLNPTPNVPKTGDNEDLALAMFGMLLSLAAIAVVLKNKKFFAKDAE